VRIVSGHAGEEGLSGFDRGRLRGGGVKRGTDCGESLAFVAGGEQPEVADALEAGRPHAAPRSAR
jgi:hypothetical protein